MPIDIFFTGRPSVVASNWKSTVHTVFGAAAVGTSGVVDVPVLIVNPNLTEPLCLLAVYFPADGGRHQVVRR